MNNDIQKRIFLVKKYYEFQSIALVKRTYWSKYKNETTPSNNTILNMVSVLKKTWSVAFMTHNNEDPGRKRKVAKNEVKNLISKLPSLSIRKATSAVGVSPMLVFMTFCIQKRLTIKNHTNFINGTNWKL